MTKDQNIKWSISFKIALTVAVLVSISTFSIGFLINSKDQKVIEEQSLDRLKYEVRSKSQKLLSPLEALQTDVSYLAGTPPILGIARAVKNGGVDPRDGSTVKLWKSRLSLIFQELLQAKKNYSQVRYIGVADGGREVVRVDRRGTRIEVVPNELLQRKGDRPYFKGALQAAPGEVYVSHFNLNRENGKISLPEVPTLRVASPVYFNGKYYGMVIINYDTRSLFGDFFFNTPKIYTPYLVDEEGHYLVHPRKEFSFSWERSSSPRLVTEDFPGLLEKANADLRTQEYLDSNQDKYFYFSKVYYDPMVPQRFLGVVVEVAKDEILAEAREIRNEGYLLCIVLALFSGLLSFVFAKRISLPLLKLVHASESFARGDSEVILPEGGGDEIGYLSKSFALMIGEVNKRTTMLALSEQMQKAVLNTAIDGIISVDNKCQINQANLAIERMFGYSREQINSLGVDELFRNSEASSLGEEELVSAKWLSIKGAATFELIGIRKDGSFFPATVSVGETWVESKRYFTGVVRDETEQLDARSKIQAQHAQLLSLGEMSASIAHDITNPLSIIDGYMANLSKQLQSESIDRGKVKKIAEKSSAAVKRISKIVSGFKSMARNADGDPFESVTCNSIIENCVGVIGEKFRKGGVRLEVRELNRDLSVECRSAQIEQVLVNLLNNARQEAQKVKDPLVTINVCDLGKDVELSVEDNGLGVPLEIRDRIMSPFFTTKEKGVGTGLGLSISKKIIETHNGRLYLDEASDKTRFVIRLPKKHAPEGKKFSRAA